MDTKTKQTKKNPVEDRVHNLEQLLIRMAHQSGVSHVLIKNAGLEPYNPTQGDMSKFRKV